MKSNSALTFIKPNRVSIVLQTWQGKKLMRTDTIASLHPSNAEKGRKEIKRLIEEAVSELTN